MRRIIMWIATTAAVTTLLFGYRTSTMGALDSSAPAGASAPQLSSESGGPSSANDSGSSSATGDAGGSATSNSDSSSGSHGSSTPKAKTITGTAASTRYGPVQLELTVKGSTITAVRMLDYPYNNPRDQQINSAALPILIQETLDAQSTQIDMVSGATYTSTGYLQSLQSALDQMG